MDASVVVLLVLVAVIVAAIALHLIAIAASLRKITGTLNKVKGGVVAIKGQTDPVGDVIGGIASDAAAIDNDLEGLLVIVGEAQAAAAAAPPPPISRPAARRSRSSKPAPAAVDLEQLVDFDDGTDESAVRRPSMQEAVARARSNA